MHQVQPTFEVDGPAIRELRMEAGLTTAQLADAIGCSRVYLSHIEVGIRKRMGPQFFAALRTVLEVRSSAILLAPTEEKTPERSTSHGPA